MYWFHITISWGLLKSPFIFIIKLFHLQNEMAILLKPHIFQININQLRLIEMSEFSSHQMRQFSLLTYLQMLNCTSDSLNKCTAFSKIKFDYAYCKY